MTFNELRSAESNHRVVVDRHGGPEVLKLIEEPLPEPAVGEVRLKVLAAGVSAYDLMHRSTGAIPGSEKPPFTLGGDVVGVVDKVGDGVVGIGPGQTAAAFITGGGNTEYICLTADTLVPVPEGIDPAEAVCLIANYLTAWVMLHETAGVKAGERALVHGAAGGVGTAVLELGRLAGLELYGTASSYNHELVSSLGAEPIDYRTEDFVKRVRQLTGDGVDVVFDPIGGARQLWRSYRCLRPGGRLIWFGVAAFKKSGAMVIPLSLLTIGLLKLFPRGRSAPMTPNLGEYAPNHPDWYRRTLGKLFDLLNRGELRPRVAARVPLAEARKAHELLERGGYAGKVVLVTG